MTNRSLITVILLLFCASCEISSYGFESRKNLDKSIKIFYKDEDVTTDINLITKVSKYKNRYCGVMISQLLSNQDTKEMELFYNDKKSGIYPDTIADVIYFWDRKNWNSQGFREEKICVDFGDVYVDLNSTKVVTKKIPKRHEFDIKKACTLVSPNSDAAKDCVKLGY
jgi:hypothetical protein